LRKGRKNLKEVTLEGKGEEGCLREAVVGDKQHNWGKSHYRPTPDILLQTEKC